MSSKNHELERPRPTFFVIGHLSGVKRKDAEQYVRGLVMRYATSPEAAGFYLMHDESGFFYEIQEGGDGRAYLPAVIGRLRNNPGSRVCIALASRMAEVRMTDSGPVSTLLPEGEGEPEAFEPGPRLTPLDRDRSRMLVAAVASFCASSAALASALVVSSFLSAHPAVQNDATASLDSFPIRHWPSQIPDGEYVAALRFDGARWVVERKAMPDKELETFQSFSSKMGKARAR